MDVKLPIEVIPNTVPPKFRWRQIVEGFNGERHVQICEGALPAGVDIAVQTIIGVANQLLSERAGLLARVAELEAIGHGPDINQPVDMPTTPSAPVSAIVSQGESGKGKKLR